MWDPFTGSHDCFFQMYFRALSDIVVPDRSWLHETVVSYVWVTAWGANVGVRLVEGAL